MALRVVGAGVGRTGTHSLKLALERLLGAPCYHMVEVFQHPEHVPRWMAAARGELPDWSKIMNGYAAAVDWPACGFWRELSAANPDAIILLSTRDPASWWESAHSTIFQPGRWDQAPSEWLEMVRATISTRFTDRIEDRDACIAAYERHNAQVRAEAPKDRLLEWTATDGWEPICSALGLPVPAEAFPRSNTREDWAARQNQSGPPDSLLRRPD